MNHRVRFTSAAAIVLPFVVAVLLSASLTGCGRDTPQSPRIIYLQGTSGDNGSDESTQEQMIPTGAVPFSIYLPGDGTTVGIFDAVFGLNNKTSMVIARIDYSIANRATTAIQFLNSYNPGTVMTQYRLPASVPAAGTFTLTYPVEPGYVGYGFAIRIADTSTYVAKLKLSGGVAADYVTLHGYAY